jgi:hypothetical protein
MLGAFGYILINIHPSHIIYNTVTVHVIIVSYNSLNRLYGLVARVSGYRSKGPAFDSWRFQFFWEAAGLERGPLNLVRTTEELLEGKVASPIWKTEINDRRNLLR